ncbi:MAG: C-terminal helicase domain-containing protein, partial [Desulfobulbaceae bacterium]|nr:C-terminal helicase domain-containing protein [Desulfobulbaceae bacterium]
PIATVKQVLFSVEQSGKTSLLKDIMAKTNMAATLIFTRTKHRAASLAGQLHRAGYAATSLQGNLSQQKRQKALNGFKRGEFKVLVATDIAARGIDVSGISHVINFDVPDTVDAFTHRIGRTGRASCTGEAYTFAGRDDRKIIVQIEKLLGKKMGRIDGFGSNVDLPGETFPAAERPAKKPWKNAKKNNRITGRSNGRPTGRNAASANAKNQEQPYVRNHKAGGRQKSRSRAAMMVDSTGNLFLNP